MANVSKADKAKIVAAVKEVMPKNWKASFAVRDDSFIVMTVKNTPFTLEDIFGKEKCEALDERHYFNGVVGHVEVNHRYLDNSIKNKEVLDVLKKVVVALNKDNYSNSDCYTDYHDVGHGVELQFGSYKNPYVAKAA